MEIHVIYRGGKKWALRKPGKKKAFKLLKSLKDAETFARQMPEVSKIFVHRKDGTVARVITISYEEGRGKVTTIDFRPEELSNGTEDLG